MQVDWNVNISINFKFKRIADILFQNFVWVIFYICSTILL